MNRRIIFLLVLLENTKADYYSNLNSKFFTSNAPAHGSEMSTNDNFTVYTLDAYKIYLIHILSGPIEFDCGSQYIHPEFYVYSLSAMKMRDNSTISFIQIAENTTSKEAVLSVITINSDYCVGNLQSQAQAHNTVVWGGGHQEYMSIKIDPQEKFAYVFADSFILSYDLSTNMVDQFMDVTNGTFWPEEQVTVRAFDLTNQLALVVGYTAFSEAKALSHCGTFLVQLRPFRVISQAKIISNIASTAETLVYNREYDLSLSFDSLGLFVAIGMPRFNRVVLIKIPEYFDEETYSDLNLSVNEFALSTSISSEIFGYGRSVAWLDDQGTLAVLVETSKNQVWSISEVRVYSNITYSIQLMDAIPDFVFPNSQQTLGNTLNKMKPGFIQILSRFGNLIVLTNGQWLLYIQTAGPGQNAVLRTTRTYLLTYVYEVNPCLNGTYKNTTSIGPCTVCPPQTKNPGNSTFLVTECLPCKQTSFCPLGATNDVNLDDFPSYMQTFSYPDSPDIDNFDDLLILKIFSISNKPHCIVLSPIFWTILVIAVCSIVWFIMYLLKIYERRGSFALGPNRKRAKVCFKHMDIIFEGERWIGGLASFAVIVLIGFTCWFAGTYHSLYPFEKFHDLLAPCQVGQYNSAFDNGLQLPLSNSDGSRWTIFDMLDSQPFSLSVDLINSPIQCTDIRIQQNRRSVLPISIPMEKCNSSNNVTISFSFDLPGHITTVQIDILGPYFIGAVRFCLHGPSSVENRVNILHELDTCTLFYTSNQTIGLSTDFTVRLIKVVNITKPLKIGDDDQYDGRWAPTMISDTLSDKLFFEQNGQYLRYVSDRTTFTIEFSEESYFLQNNEKPIIRAAALSFHTLLFISLILEIFTTTFLIYKVCCQPLIKIGRNIILISRLKRKSQLELSDENSETEGNSQLSSYSTVTVDANHHDVGTMVDNIPTNFEMRLDELVNNRIAKLIHDGYILRSETHPPISLRNPQAESLVEPINSC